MVLVVDDDPAVRSLLKLLLETEGHAVVEAAHGAAALEAIRPDPLPDIVTTDLMMPLVDGVELIGRLRSEPRTAGIPILVISGDREVAADLHASGLVEAFVSKPFDSRVLARCVRELALRAGPASSVAVKRAPRASRESRSRKGAAAVRKTARPSLPIAG